MAPFSAIAFGIVVWTIAVYGAKQLRFRLKTDQCGRSLWRAFSNGSVFGDRLWRCSVDDSRIRSKTAPFSFETGLVWTGPQARFETEAKWNSEMAY